MKRELIDKEELIDFFFSDYSGTDMMIREEISKFPLMEEEYFDEAYQLCENIIENCINVIKTAEVLQTMEVE